MSRSNVDFVCLSNVVLRLAGVTFRRSGDASRPVGGTFRLLDADDLRGELLLDVTDLKVRECQKQNQGHLDLLGDPTLPSGFGIDLPGRVGERDCNEVAVRVESGLEQQVYRLRLGLDAGVDRRYQRTGEQVGQRQILEVRLLTRCLTYDPLPFDVLSAIVSSRTSNTLVTPVGGSTLSASTWTFWSYVRSIFCDLLFCFW